jgi:transcriptional regulator with XRE-family HTH domain
MRARRKELGLSQTELATVLDVDVTSIYRRERDKVLPILWDYALRGIEAEAAHPDTRTVVRGFRRMSRPPPTVIPEGMGNRGYRFVAVRMFAVMRENMRKAAKVARLKRKVQRSERKAGKAVVVDLPKRDA